MSTELLLESPAAVPPPNSGYDAAVSRLQSFLTRTRAWIGQNAGRVARVYLVADTELTLYVVGQSGAYDFELRRSLTELIAAFKDDGYPATGSIVPPGTADELRAFFDPDRAFTLSPA